MRLVVNGVEIRVVDRIEVVLDVAEEGDTILNGVDVHIRVRGGPLTVCKGKHPIAAFHLHHDSPLTFIADTIGYESFSITHGDTSADGVEIIGYESDHDALPWV